MTMTNKNFTEIVSVMKIDWLEDPNIIDVLWYELPETQDEAIKLFNYFKKDIVDLERCDSKQKYTSTDYKFFMQKNQQMPNFAI